MLSGFRSGSALFGVTTTDGGLKRGGIGNGRFGMNTGALGSIAGFGCCGAAAGAVATSDTAVFGGWSVTVGDAVATGGAAACIAWSCARDAGADGDGTMSAEDVAADALEVAGGTTTRGVATGVGVSDVTRGPSTDFSDAIGPDSFERVATDFVSSAGVDAGAIADSVEAETRCPSVGVFSDMTGFGAAADVDPGTEVAVLS